MYEYRVESYSVKSAAREMNTLAQEGWRVISVVMNITKGYGLIVTFERKVCDRYFEQEDSEE